MTANKLNYTNDDGIFANIKNVVNNNADLVGASSIRLDEIENDLTTKIEASDLQTALDALFVEPIDPTTLNPAIYLDADSLVLSDKSDVIRWFNFGSLGSAGDYTTYVVPPTMANGTNNGRNAVHFDGTTGLALSYTGTSNDYVISMLIRPEATGLLVPWSNGVAPYFAIRDGQPQYYLSGGNAQTELTVEPVNQWFVMSVRVVGTLAKVYVGRNQVASATVPAGVLRGELLGMFSGYPFIGKMAKLFVLDDAIVDSDFANLIASFCSTAGIPDQVVSYFIGDSITQGFNSATNSGFVEQLSRRRKDYRCINHGNAGDTIAMCEARAVIGDKHALRVDGYNACFAFCGTNNTVTGEDSATTIAAYVAFCNARRTAGWKVIAVTQAARNDAYTANRDAFNTYVRDNYASFSDSLCDVALVFTDYNDPELYDDGVHFKDAGHARMSKLAEDSIDALNLLPTPITQVLPSTTTDGIDGAVKTAIDAIYTTANTFTAQQSVVLAGGNNTRTIAQVFQNTVDVAVGPGNPNDYQNEVHVVLQAGTTTNHRRYIDFKNYDNTDSWIWGVNAGGAAIFYDSDSCHRIWMYKNGQSIINAGDTYGVAIGTHPSDTVGTGGFQVYSGGIPASQVKWFDIDTSFVDIYRPVRWGLVEGAEVGRLTSDGTNAFMDAFVDGGHIIFRDNVSGVMTTRLSTTSTGVTVTGTVTASGAGTHTFGPGSISTVEMTDGATRCYSAGGSWTQLTGFGFSSSGTFYVDAGASGGILIRCDAANANAVQFAVDGSSTFYALATALARFQVGASGPTWHSGSGTPEGSVIGVVGSLYSRTDGGASTSLYVKESGVGNTGWVAK